MTSTTVPVYLQLKPKYQGNNPTMDLVGAEVLHASAVPPTNSIAPSVAVFKLDLVVDKESFQPVSGRINLTGGHSKFTIDEVD